MSRFFIICCCLALFACNEVKPEGEITPEKKDSALVYKASTPSFVFGFIAQNRYSYCPSAALQEDGSVHLFFCGNPNSGIMVDNIYHQQQFPDGTKTSAKSVLQPGGNITWDSHHTCDPSVVEGVFHWDNTTYKYALFFLSNMLEVYYNEIGVAFSNSLDADSWVKYPHQIVAKTWDSEGDQKIGDSAKSWGVGQPSAISLDKNGKILLTYTIGDVSGTRIAWRELDFSSMSNPIIGKVHTMVTQGLYRADDKTPDYICNCDFAINQEEDRIIMVRPLHPNPTTYPTYIDSAAEVDYMRLSDFMNSVGKWTKMFRLTEKETAFPRNHNSGILRDNYGHIRSWRTPTIYFTVSKASPDVSAGYSTHAEWTYHIYKTSLSNYYVYF